MSLKLFLQVLHPYVFSPLPYLPSLPPLNFLHTWDLFPCTTHYNSTTRVKESGIGDMKQKKCMHISSFSFSALSRGRVSLFVSQCIFSFSWEKKEWKWYLLQVLFFSRTLYIWSVECLSTTKCKRRDFSLDSQLGYRAKHENESSR